MRQKMKIKDGTENRNIFSKNHFFKKTWNMKLKRFKKKCNMKLNMLKSEHGT